MYLREIVKEAHATAVEKGWWDSERNVFEQIALVHSELSEALEEARVCSDLTLIDEEEEGKPVGFSIELADAIIRIADMCGALGIDLERAVFKKLAYNKTRPYRHGDKLA